MKLVTRGIPSADAIALQAGGLDANGQPPQRQVAQGSGNPCRHCLQLIPAGNELLVLNYRPFATLQPYAETGPIFLHTAPCAHYESDRLPEWFTFLSPAIVRGYGADDRINYETGTIVRSEEILETCQAIASRADVAYVHVRSKFNCFQFRLDRA
jgi:hypothetical protein